MASKTVANRNTHDDRATVVEAPVLVEAVRWLRAAGKADAQRVLDAIRCLKGGRLSADELTAAVAAGTFRQVIDAAAASR